MMTLEQAIASASPWTLRYLAFAIPGRWSCTLAREGFYLRTAVGETHIEAVLAAIAEPEIPMVEPPLSPSERVVVQSVFADLLNRYRPAQPRINRRI